MNKKKDMLIAREPLDLTEKQVKEYLEKNSDFFDRHPDLIAEFKLPHTHGGTASLLEKQVSVLREKNVELRHQISTLSDTARENDVIFNNTRALIVSLLDAKNLKELNDAFCLAMENTFKAEYFSMIIFDKKKSNTNMRMEPLNIASKSIGAIIKGRKPVCGALRKAELDFLFPEAKEAGSAAVMPLVRNVSLGVVAIGSSDATYFNSNMGTLFLSHIGEILIRVIPKIMPNPKS